jgi:hypothetical protein
MAKVIGQKNNDIGFVSPIKGRWQQQKQHDGQANHGGVSIVVDAKSLARIPRDASPAKQVPVQLPVEYVANRGHSTTKEHIPPR